jgi:hypothetical protein
MWAFRRDPESMTPEGRQALEGLFEKVPKLKDLYRIRLRFKEIFDTARDRTIAARWLRRLRQETKDLGLDLGAFFTTYDRWKTEILNYTVADPVLPTVLYDGWCSLRPRSHCEQRRSFLRAGRTLPVASRS